MTVRERVNVLAAVVAEFPEMGGFGDAGQLWELVEKEFDQTKAVPKTILHIISANTAMAGMQSLVRGLILGSQNWCKTPGAGLPRFEEMVDRLPPALRRLVEMSAILPPEWLENAEAVIVFGSDTTVEKFRAAMRPEQIFAGYGNRWSGAVIFTDLDFASVPLVTRDICLYEQMGCLSAQILWLHKFVDAMEYSERLARSLADYVKIYPPPPVDFDTAASIARWRLSAEWMTVADTATRVWLSEGEPVWGVVYQEENQPPGLSCLHRHVFLRNFNSLPKLGPLAGSVSTLGVWPPGDAHLLAGSGASRICTVGEMQFPAPTWQQDAFPALGRLLRNPVPPR